MISRHSSLGSSLWAKETPVENKPNNNNTFFHICNKLKICNNIKPPVAYFTGFARFGVFYIKPKSTRNNLVFHIQFGNGHFTFIGCSVGIVSLKRNFRLIHKTNPPPTVYLSHPYSDYKYFLPLEVLRMNQLQLKI